MSTASPTRQKNPDNPTLEVARITARQAIVVALITSLAGVVGAVIGYFANQHGQSTPVAFHRISFDGVTFPEQGAYAVRLVADVNGQAYSYPSRTVWADLGPTMPKEEFPLLPAAEYRVHFQAYLRLPNGDVEMLQSQPLQLAPPGIDLEYDLFPVDKGFTRGVSPALSIKYHVQ